jgi:putative holliday junction resolvase
VRIGVRLGIDVGKARVGIARCDREGLLATPVATLARESAVAEILECVVGQPLSLSGNHTASTQDAYDFAQELGLALGVSIRMIDERLSTVQATRDLRQAGKSAKKQRSVVDQVAAVILLQHALDSERIQGVAPGHALEPRVETDD